MKMIDKNKIFYLIIVIGIFLFNSIFAEIKEVNVKYKGSVNDRIPLRVSQIGDVCFVSAKELAEKLQCNITINKPLRKAVLYPEGRQVKISGENPFIMIGENVYQLPVEVKYIGGELFIPLNYFIENLNDALSGSYVFDKNKGILEVDLGGYNLRSISIDEKKNGTLIRIGASEKFKKFSSLSLPSGWLGFQIIGGKIDTLDKGNYPSIGKNGNIRKIIVDQMEDLVQISVKLQGDVEGHVITQDEKSKEIQISLTGKMPEGSEPTVNIAEILREQKKNWEINTIVLDAGHGGRDPGTRGINGTKEKDIVLDITKRLGKLLEKNLKLDVKYTRLTDKFVPLWERTRYANSVKGKLFISIHANSTGRRLTNVRGMEIYLLSSSKDKSSIEVAKRENKVVEEYENIERYEQILNGDNMLFAIMQSGFIKESEELASLLLDNVIKKTKVVRRGVKQGGFVVLVGASMPSVLVEVGFLNNRIDEANLRRREYRQKAAEGLFEGIREFIRSSRREIARVN